MQLSIVVNLPNELSGDFTDADVAALIENGLRNMVKVNRIGKRHRTEREAALATGKTMSEANAIAEAIVAPIRTGIDAVVAPIIGSVTVERS